MTVVALSCLALVLSTTLLHYEALRLLTLVLPLLRMAPRARLIVVLLATFATHALEIVLYAAATYALVRATSAGTLGAGGPPAWTTLLYYSAETYTSLGYGDIVPQGALRALSGVEALNGLLLIGWTASFTYVAMQQLWGAAPDAARSNGGSER
jgi:Ion channel